jgi:hypothetical protein
MRPKFGQQHRIKWIAAFGESAWTNDEELSKLIHQFEKPTPNTLLQPEFYISTSGKPEQGKPYINIHGIPKGWIQTLKQIK